MRGESFSNGKALVRGGSELALLDNTISGALIEAEERWPNVDAVVSVHQGIRLTFSELRQRADALARGFLALGLARGDRVAVWSPNSVEWLLTQLATATAGLVLVNLNPAYRRTEAEFALKKTGARALVTACRHKTSDYLGMVEDMDLRPLGGSGSSCPDLEFLVKIGGSRHQGWIDFQDLERGGHDHQDRLEAIKATLNPDDPVNIQFTSGTTGTPKGATLSHRNILNNGFFTGHAIRLQAAERVCVPVPLYHCFGMVMGNLACLTHGATIIYPAPSFDPLATLQAVEQERCTALYGVPTMFISMLQHAEFATFDLASLRTGIMAGAPCPTEIMREVVDRMHMPEIIIAYGMTETSPVSFASSVDDPLQLRVETVGRVLPHLEARIVDEAGETVSAGLAGEICVRGYSVMIGYWDEPEATASVLDAGGWMHTGDLGSIDEDGFCRIVGRLKDLIIRGGENIYPREIEEFLYGHPSIEEVSVIGIPDERLGEEVCAWIKVHEAQELDEAQVRAFCLGRMAHYKVPKVIRFVNEFPMTVTGKIQKFEMRRLMAQTVDGGAPLRSPC